MLNRHLRYKIEALTKAYDSIDSERKKELQEIAKAIAIHRASHEDTHIAFICTHNSRRSQLAQLWMTVACFIYKIEHLVSHSAGTETTAFNIRMVRALRRFGFDLMSSDSSDNPHYELRIDPIYDVNQRFHSKKWDDSSINTEGLIAIMVCDHAHETCPIIPGVAHRMALLYTDPKHADDTPQESEAYDQKILEIGREILYMGSLLKGK